MERAPMTPYQTTVVQHRDVRGELRNVALLTISPTSGEAWLDRAPLKERAHLVGDEMTFVKALLDVLRDEANEVARRGSPAEVQAWLRARATPTEDTLSFTPPAFGVTDDLHAERERIRELTLGRPSARGAKSPAERLRDGVLSSLGLSRRFLPRDFLVGPARWSFPKVAQIPDGLLVLNAIHFAQQKPELILDAAFHNVGRMGELRRAHQAVDCLTVATGPSAGPTGQAFWRAQELLRDGGLNLVPATAQALSLALAERGLVGEGFFAEA